MFTVLRVPPVLARGTSKRSNVVTNYITRATPATGVVQPICDVTATQSYHVLSGANIETRRRLAGLYCRHYSASGGVFPPIPALVLGVSGGLSFLLPPLYMMDTGVFCTTLEFAHLAYSASFISFIGGIRWGLTLSPGSGERPNWRNLTYSVTPLLLGYGGLVLQSPYGYIPITIGLLSTFIIDLSWAGYPKWFKGLRIILTILAGMSFALMAKLKYEVLLEEEAGELKSEE